MGHTYAECTSKFNTCGKLVAISEGCRAPSLAASYGVDNFAEYADLLARPAVDAVLIATLHSLHRAQVLAAAEHGKHVLVEKPMATSVSDCDAMITACQRAAVTLEEIQTLRLRATLAPAKALIDDGEIGACR